MAITCPRCGSQFDATLFQFGHRVRCRCGAEIEYPGTDLRTGHVLFQEAPMDVTNINCASAFTTKDGSEIRELLSHRNSCIRRQSLAEARLPVNGATTPHYHPRTEEIYYIVEGHGSMRVGNEIRLVGPGDAIAIPPGARHQIRNTGSVVLKFLCCCAPAYEDEDTVLDQDG